MSVFNSCFSFLFAEFTGPIMRNKEDVYMSYIINNKDEEVKCIVLVDDEDVMGFFEAIMPHPRDFELQRFGHHRSRIVCKSRLDGARHICRALNEKSEKVYVISVFYDEYKNVKEIGIS